MGITELKFFEKDKVFGLKTGINLVFSQPVITCSKLTIETLEKDMQNVQSQQKTSEQHNWLSTCISEKYSVNIRRAEK